MISTRAEVEQEIIDNSVTVDREQRKTVASLPFIEDPVKNLSPNREVAMQVFKSQVRRLNKDPQAKADVLASHEKLRNLGFVDKVKNLSEEQRKTIFGAAILHPLARGME